MDRISCTWANPPVTYSNQLISYPKTVFWSEVDFDFHISYLQPAPGKLMLFVHIDVYYWSSDTWRRLKHLWSSNRHLLPPIVFAQGDETDAKWVKFVSRLGFQPLVADVPCDDGQFRHIYVNFRR